MMKCVKKNYKVILLTTLLLAVMVCTCPLPRRIDFEGEGGRLSGSSIGEDAKVTIEGWYYQFLFFDDFMKITVNIEDPEGGYQFEVEQEEPFIYEQDGQLFANVYSAYMVGSKIRQVFMLGESSWKNVVIGISGPLSTDVYAASQNGNAELQPLVEEYLRLNAANRAQS